MKQSSLDLINQIDEKNIKLLEKVWVFLSANIKQEPRKGWSLAAKQAHDNGDDLLLISDVFDDEKLEDITIIPFGLDAG